MAHSIEPRSYPDVSWTLKNTFVHTIEVVEDYKPRRTKSCPARLCEFRAVSMNEVPALVDTLSQCRCCHGWSERAFAGDIQGDEFLSEVENECINNSADLQYPLQSLHIPSTISPLDSQSVDDDAKLKKKRKRPAKRDKPEGNHGKVQEPCAEPEPFEADRSTIEYPSLHTGGRKHDKPFKKERLPVRRPLKVPLATQNYGKSGILRVSRLHNCFARSARSVAQARWPVCLCMVMLVIIFVGELSPLQKDFDATSWQSDSKSLAQPLCSEYPIPPWVQQTFDFEDEPQRVKPVIILYASCFLRSFAEITYEYTPSASAWYFVKIVSGAPRVELRHWHEDPLTKHKRLNDTASVVRFLEMGALPRVGRLTDESTEYYGSFTLGRGLVLGLFNPKTHMDLVDQLYRPMLTTVGEVLKNTYEVAYMDTKKYRTWISSEFGVTTFPTIAVFKHFPGTPFLHTGKMDAETVLQFVQDVDDGCVRVRARQNPFANSEPSRSHDVCDASEALVET